MYAYIIAFSANLEATVKTKKTRITEFPFSKLKISNLISCV